MPVAYSSSSMAVSRKYSGSVVACDDTIRVSAAVGVTTVGSDRPDLGTARRAATLVSR